MFSSINHTAFSPTHYRASDYRVRSRFQQSSEIRPRTEHNPDPRKLLSLSLSGPKEENKGKEIGRPNR